MRLQEVALSAVPVGTEARVKRVAGEGSLRRRLLEMGLIPGIVIKVEGASFARRAGGFPARGWHVGAC